MGNAYFHNFPPPFRFSPYYYQPYNYYKRPNYKKNNNQEEEKINKAPNKQDELNNSRSIENVNIPIFEIFGISLFFDDILLISLIFFLYNEGVQDNFLYIALILLLLS